MLGALERSGTDPLTGFYRDGCCATGPSLGWHTICAVMTTEFLAHQRSVGNDLLDCAPAGGCAREVVPLEALGSCKLAESLSPRAYE